MPLAENMLQSISLFSNISPESFKKIAGIAKVHFYKKGTYILNDSQAQNTFLYVVNGWIKLFKESSDGEEIIIDILTNSHYCGEQFIFQTDVENIYTALAISDIKVLTLPLQTLKQLIQTDHILSLNFLQATLQKQHQLNMHVEHLSIQSALHRIGCFILRLCSLHLAEKESTIAVKLPYDKFLLATRLGMRAETFSRALTKLCKQCDIKVKGDTVYVNDIKKLSAFVCEQCSKTFPCKDVIHENNQTF
ncbi:MAG: hypothetical protein K0S08_2175 [Gammaproteobacteria bacterium]|jgi:CRP-like cAMP-binding protein|nr:hypothetical protein [Gammaproteobacteria bacterium]